MTVVNVTDATLKGSVTGPTFSGNVDGSKFTGAVTYADTAPIPPDPIPPDGGITAGNYYVSTAGSDSNNGTSVNTAFKTLGKAASVVNPGQTVLVKGGTYPSNTIFMGRHGTSAQPIVFANYGTEEVIIDGKAANTTDALIQLNSNYTTVKGLKIQNSRGTGIAAWSTIGSKMLNNTITGSQKGGIWVGGPSGGGSRDNVVSGNTVYNNMLANANHAFGSAGGWTAGISLQYTDNVLAEGNHPYENWGEGIGINFDTNAKVRNNKVHDCYCCCIYPDNSSNAEISGNFCYWSGDSKWGYLGSGKPDGIRMARENQSLPLDGLKIFNNIVIGTLHGVSYLNYMAGGGVQNTKVYCNTFINADIHFEASSATRGCEFKNNIIDGGGVTSSISGWVSDYNCWDKGQGGSFAGTHDVNAEPGFVGQSGAFDDKAYDLKSTSPCKQKGVNVVAVVAKDYAKVARPASGAFSIGGYE